MKATTILIKRNIKLYKECVTNQIFVVIDNNIYEGIKMITDFNLWEDLNDKKVIRLVCNFKITKKEIDDFLVKLDALLK